MQIKRTDLVLKLVSLCVNGKLMEMFALFAYRIFLQHETFSLFSIPGDESHLAFFSGQAGRWGSGPARTGNQENYMRAGKHAPQSAGIVLTTNNPRQRKAPSKQRQRKTGHKGKNRVM